jgi:plastocyanin
MAKISLGRLSITLVTVLVALAALAAACGGSDESDVNGDSPTDAPTAAPDATEEPDPMDGPGSSLPTSITVSAVDNVFVGIQPSQAARGVIEAPANTEFSVKLINDGVLPHNISFFDSEGGSILADGANGDIILEAETDNVTFTTPDPGTYFFVCVVHPLEMLGEFVVS